MAWNRPSESNSQIESQRSKRGVRKGILAGLCFVVLAGAAVWFIAGGEGGKQSEDANRDRRIKEVKPAKIAKEGPSAERGVQSAKSEGVKNEVPSAAPVAASVPKPSTPTRRVITNRLFQAKSRYQVFDHQSENELAFLACMPVGTLVIGSRDYDEDFMKDLEKAMVNKIEIKPDDAEDVKWYKQSVIDMKKQLREMLKNGDDIAAALTNTRKELQKLGVYKAQLEAEIHELQAHGENVTDDDVEDFVKAANVMLKEKGIEPFEFNPLTKTIISRLPFPDPNEPDPAAVAAEEAALQAEGENE